MSRTQRLRSWLSRSAPAGLTGAFFLMGASVIVSSEFGPVQALATLVVGALYGIAVRAVMGLFPVHSWGLIFTGIVSGPIPGAIILSLRHRSWASSDDRGGAWFFALLLGLLVGLIEFAAEWTALRQETYDELG